MKNKLLCFIGWHKWTWSLREANEAGFRIDGTIPPFAKCKRCGRKYE